MARWPTTLAALLVLGFGGPAAHATELYAYVGNTPVTGLIPLENMIDRKVDGVVVFNDYRYTPEYAIPNIGYGASLLPPGYKLAISVGLAFGQPSKDPAHLGAHTLADVAAGRLDGVYAALGKSLVAKGFAAADIRLGWEENGTWYAWSARPDPATFRAAFTRVAAVLHATPGSRFTVWFNPGVGTVGSDQAQNRPHAGYDGVAWDVYATAWSGAWIEPWLWQASLKGPWGIDTLGVWPTATTPLAIPEFGVGSHGGGDPHGAPDANNKHNGGDDGLFMRNALEYFVAHHARWVGYWDFNAGDYNSKISDGSRPHEALAFLQVMGPPHAVKLLAAATLSPTRVATPAGLHSLLADLPGGARALLLWGDDRKPRRFDLALPPSPRGPATVTALDAQRERPLGRVATLRGFAYAGGLSVLKLTP